MRKATIGLTAAALLAGGAKAAHYEIDQAWKGYTYLESPTAHNPQYLAANGIELNYTTKEKMYEYDDGKEFKDQQAPLNEYMYLMTVWDYEDVERTTLRAYAEYDSSNAVIAYVWDPDLDGYGGWHGLGGIYKD